jgi:hypothetical protein
MKMKGVEVFAVGRWNGIEFTHADLSQMAEAFAKLKDVHKVPLKFGHNAEQPVTDGKPALGWVTDMYVRGSKLLADFDDVPDVVHKAIDKKLYRRVSIELSIGVKYKSDRLPFVVDAVALLGADIPAVNTLADLNAFLSRDGAQFTVERRELFSAVAGSIEEVTEMDRKEMEGAVTAAVEAAIAPLKTQFTALETSNKTLQTENQRLTAENAALTQKNAQFTADKAKEGIAAKRTRAKAVLEGLAAGGHILPAQREYFTKTLGIENDEKLAALNIEEFVATFGELKEVAGADGKVAFTKPSAGDLGTKTGDKKDSYTYEEACDTLQTRTQKLVNEKNIAFTVAKEQVLTEDAALLAAYTSGIGPSD